ncbi:MAG: carboxymuconolactone decarboxylase family protein [Halocynthiibacter sp.]
MNWKEYMSGMKNAIRGLNKAHPEITKAFGGLSAVAKDGKVLDVKTLEFVALGIAIADRCEACIGFHVEALAKAGGTRDELNDVLAMAIQMGGGPSVMYASKALDAWDQLVADK